MKLDCGHSKKVFCYKTNGVQVCYTKCSSKLECGHTCPGTCHDCSGARFHAPCNQVCGKPLVCGHVCKERCGLPCICLARCQTRCGHSACTKVCAMICNNNRIFTMISRVVVRLVFPVQSLVSDLVHTTSAQPCAPSHVLVPCAPSPVSTSYPVVTPA